MLCAVSSPVSAAVINHAKRLVVIAGAVAWFGTPVSVVHGGGIATACALSGVRVLLKEINQKFLDAGMARVRANLASNVKKGRMTSQKADAIYSLCTPCLTYDKFKEADMVIALALALVIFRSAEASIAAG